MKYLFGGRTPRVAKRKKIAASLIKYLVRNEYYTTWLVSVLQLHRQELRVWVSYFSHEMC
jgi:hypothetical protein